MYTYIYMCADVITYEYHCNTLTKKKHIQIMSMSLNIYIYVCMYVCMYVCLFV